MESFPFYKSWNHDAPELYFASKCCINYPAGDYFFYFCDVHSTSEVYKFFLLLMFKLKLQEMSDGTVLLRLAHLYEVLDKWDKIILF